MSARKLVLSYLLLVVSLFVTPLSALAVSPNEPTASASVTTNYELRTTNYELPAAVSPTSPLYTDLLVNNMFHTFSCLAIGQSIIGQPCLTYRLTKNAQGMIQGIPILSSVNTSGGTLGAVTSVIALLYQNPPVRTADYLASVGHGLGIVKEARAQGVGGSGAAVLSPIIQLWQVSRNIAYVILIIVFLVIGLMVMFRSKINPQTVITAQAALPGLVLGLVMITFSFFFAGLISDMAFVGTNVVGYYFAAAQGQLNNPDQLNLVQKLSGSNILNILGSMTDILERGDIERLSDTVFNALGGEAQNAVRAVTFWLSSQFVTPMVPTEGTGPWALAIKPAVSIATGLLANTNISPILGLVLGLVATLALIYAMVKVLFKLLSAWLTIIFLTISAPFQFLFAALPGRQGMATGWMLNMLGNILVFPAVITVIYFVAFLLGPDQFARHCPKDQNDKCLIQISAAGQTADQGFVPPVYAAGNEIISTTAFPLFGGMDLSFIRVLLAFGALMALPSIPDLITRSIGKAGQAGQLIGQEIMGNAQFAQGPTQRMYGAGIEFGQNTKTALIGETQVDASGNIRLIRQGLFRTGLGQLTTQPRAGGLTAVGRFRGPLAPLNRFRKNN